MAVVIPEIEQAEGPDWQRKYPPLLAVGVALLLALVVLPSSLNLPQTNPTQTLEYAPVPPDEESQDNPPQGNLASLGLGSSAGVEGGGAGGGTGGGGEELAELALPDVGAGRNPTRFRCVGNPPRQTEDPLAPPCVPFFDGDNFGATYQGVSGDEIRLLLYFDGGISHISGSEPDNRVSPASRYFDLFKAPDPDEKEHFVVRSLRAWQKYFNERFQTYNRRVHFFIYFAPVNGEGTPPEQRRAEAADNFSKIKPFAVLSFATEGSEDAYLTAMAKRGVLNFGSFGLRPAEFFNQFPKLIWSYQPSIEQQAENYTSYICSKVVNKAPVLAANDLKARADRDNGGMRRIGILHTTDRKQPGLVAFANLVKSKVKECGGKIEATATFAQCCLAQDNGDTGTYAQQQMADFQSKGITTILWTGGINGNFGKSAAAISYYPEWIIAGDGLLDANYPNKLAQNTSTFDGRAIVVTPEVYEPALEQQRCYQAYREVDGEMSEPNLVYTCGYYRNIFQFMVGVQVAGPRLGPSSVDKGFHAIPATQSNDVQTPSCFYLPGDYTCVKDGQAEIWRAAPTPPGDNRPGCWAAIEGGRRYLAGKWPAGNIDAQITGNEPCNGHDARARFNLS